MRLANSDYAGVGVYADLNETAIIQSVQCNGTEETISDCWSSSAQCGVYRVICQGLCTS